MTSFSFFKRSAFFLVALAGLQLSAQTYTVSSGNKQGSGFSYPSEPFPGDVKVTDLEKNKLKLDVQGPALVQVWSTCCGGEPELWSYLSGLRASYEPKGLHFVSVNFENGASALRQRLLVKEFFQTQTKPEVLYLDSLGDAVDKLKINGFPTYVLVDKNGRIVFKTNGKDEEGVAVLEEELAKLLP